MARKHSKAGKKRTLKQRQRKYKGGGWGFTGASSIPGTPGTVNNAQVFSGIGDCRAVQPGYNIPYSQYGASLKGLPGMSGGRRGRSTRKGYKNKTKKQRGGRYGFFPEGAAGVTPNGAAWWAGTYPPVQRIGCEGGSFNPLNPAHTGSSAPPGAANPNYYLKGGAQMAPATYGVGNVDSMYYYAPTGGYANTASTWKDSVGAPVQIQVPYAARAMNQACLTTGGSPPLTGALQTGGRSTRKARRGGAIPFFGLSIPTFGNFPAVRQFFSNTGRRVREQSGINRLGSFFGFGSSAPAEETTTTTGANTANTTANTTPRMSNANGINANGINANGINANRNRNRNRNNTNANRNRNRNNNNLNRNTNLGAIQTTLFTGNNNNNNSSSMPAAPPPPSTPTFNSMSSVGTPEPQSPAYPPITPPSSTALNNMNSLAPPTPPTPPSTPTGNGFPASPAVLPSPNPVAAAEGTQNSLFSGEGGRTRKHKSRRSKRSALKKKKST